MLEIKSKNYGDTYLGKTPCHFYKMDNDWFVKFNVSIYLGYEDLFDSLYGHENGFVWSKNYELKTTPENRDKIADCFKSDFDVYEVIRDYFPNVYSEVLLRLNILKEVYLCDENGKIPEKIRVIGYDYEFDVQTFNNKSDCLRVYINNEEKYDDLEFEKNYLNKRVKEKDLLFLKRLSDNGLLSQNLDLTYENGWEN